MIQNSFFTNNSAQENGGALYLTFTQAFIKSSSFLGNQAKKNGGGVYSYLANTAMENCLFEDNEAQIGGAIRTIYINANLTNVSYSKNKASTYADDVVSFCVIGEYKTETDCLTCGSDLYSILE